MKKLLFVLMIVFFAGTMSQALDSFTEDLMKTGVGARPMGMGKAFVALADDSSSPFLNPAGLAGLKAWSFTSMYVSLLDGDVPYTVLSLSWPVAAGNMGLGLISTGTSNIISPGSQNLTYFDYYDRLLFLSYGLGDEKLAWGANLKLFSKGFSDGYTGSGADLDLGVKYKYNERLTLGANIQNLLPLPLRWRSGAEDDIPVLIKLGSALKSWRDDLMFALDIDLHSGRQLPALGHLGVEWTINRVLILRAGADQVLSANSDVATNPTAGVGVAFSGFRIDYAYHPYQEIFTDASHFISFSYSPPIKRAKPKQLRVYKLKKARYVLPPRQEEVKTVEVDVIEKVEAEYEFEIEEPVKVEPKKAKVKKKGRYVDHYVSVGEDLMDISRRYFGTVRYYKKIAKMNKIKNPDRIRAGQYLKIDLELDKQ